MLSLFLTGCEKEIAEWLTTEGFSGSRQVIVVTASRTGEIHATLQAYERVDGRWRAPLPAMPAVLGRAGLGKTREGDGNSPAGVYPLPCAFGSEPCPDGVTISYRQTTEHDFWVDDPASPDYNRWVSLADGEAPRWQSAEPLRQRAYRYAVVIGYNLNPIIPGKGSAIFLHLWHDADTPTAGCTAVSEDHLLTLLRWLNPEAKPVIVQGVLGEG